MNATHRHAVLEAADAVQPVARELSRRIHAHPELRFQERRAAGWLTEALEAAGFDVERGSGGLDTAFRARTEIGHGRGPHLALLAEYDALEGLGHACGHNLIAAMSTGAALALAHARDALSDAGGVLSVIGCPAEEGGGGKALLLAAGAFEGVDAALMVHPYRADVLAAPALGRVLMDVTFHGVAAHAAGAPHEGVNALDAANLFFAGLNALRQHVTSDVRMHGIVTHGGDAVNVVPKESRLTVVVRAARRQYLHGNILPRVRAVVEGAALMTGCRHLITEPAPAYEDLRHNPVLLGVFERAARAVGRQPAPSQDTTFGSTDAGNVSQVIPTVHAMLSVGRDAGLHTPDFERAAGSPEGETCLADGLRALALCAAELFLDPGLAEEAWRAHRGGDM